MPSYVEYTEYAEKKQTRTTNPAVRVTGYLEDKGEVFVKGISLESGEEIIAKLEATENKKRPSLAQLRDGYTVKGNRVVLEPGGVLVLDRAYRPEGQKAFVARWPSVMAYTAAAAEKGTATGMFTLYVEKKQDGGAYSYALKHSPEAKHFITGKTAEDLRQGIEAFAAQVSHPAFTVRAFKDSGDAQTQEVVTAGRVLGNWNHAQGRENTPQEMASTVVTMAARMQKEYPNTTFSVVPAVKLFVSKYLTEDSRKLELLEKVASHFHAKDEGQKSVAKKCCVKLGGEHHEFINDIKVIDPYSPGIDPVHMSGLIPAQDEAPKEDPDMGHIQAEEEYHTASSKEDPAPDLDPFTPFASVEDDGPSM